MRNKREDAQAQNLGDAIVAAVDLGTGVTRDRAIASALATRHLERVLARGGNRWLAAALANLARELAPTRARSVRSTGRTAAWASRQLVVVR